jgi:hypothetical protein
MPLTLHRIRERRSNIDIWNRRKDEREREKKNASNQRILKGNTYETGKRRGNTTQILFSFFCLSHCVRHDIQQENYVYI